MKQFTVNSHMLRLSWIFLYIWVIAAGMIIIFLAVGSPLWPFMLSGIVFLPFWIIIATTYPKTVLVSADSIAFQLPGSDKIQTFKHSELELSTKKGYYELVVSGTKRRKRFWISTRDIPAELKELLQDIAGAG